jgi:hypothetical protein
MKKVSRFIKSQKDTIEFVLGTITIIIAIISVVATIVIALKSLDRENYRVTNQAKSEATLKATEHAIYEETQRQEDASIIMQNLQDAILSFSNYIDEQRSQEEDVASLEEVLTVIVVLNREGRVEFMQGNYSAAIDKFQTAFNLLWDNCPPNVAGCEVFIIDE